MNHFTASGSERGGISHDVDRMNAEPRAAVSTQRRTSASIASLVVFSNFVDTAARSEEHTSELQSQSNLVCRLLLEKKKKETRTKTAAARAMTSCPSAPPPRTARSRDAASRLATCASSPDSPSSCPNRCQSWCATTV